MAQGTRGLEGQWGCGWGGGGNWNLVGAEVGAGAASKGNLCYGTGAQEGIST